MVSLAAFLFVRTGIVNSSINKLLQKEDYTTANKEFSKKVGPVARVYWCLATAIFLAIGFLKEDQRRANADLVWPLVGILFGALDPIYPPAVNCIDLYNIVFAVMR